MVIEMHFSNNRVSICTGDRDDILLSYLLCVRVNSFQCKEITVYIFNFLLKFNVLLFFCILKFLLHLLSDVTQSTVYPVWDQNNLISFWNYEKREDRRVERVIAIGFTRWMGYCLVAIYLLKDYQNKAIYII